MADLEQVMSKFSDWSFYNAHEGALLRLFHFGGRWFLSTHRKLDAFRSKWASRDSFGTLFKTALKSMAERDPKFKESLPDGENILDQFQNTLDKSKQYMFLLCNNADNRIVCNPPEHPTMYHVGTFVDGELNLDEDVGIPYPEKLSFMTIDQLLDHVENNVDYHRLQGVCCFGPGNIQIKVHHRDYQDLFTARGNEPSIKFRYLQVRMNRRLTNMLYHLYPEQESVFEDYENTLYDIAQSIHRAYIQRFIKKRYVTVPREEYQIVRECHSWHLADRENNRINIDQVIDVLNKQPPTNLNHMIRRFKAEQDKKKEGIHPRSHRGSRCTSANNSPVITGLSPGLSPKLEPLVLRGAMRLPPAPQLNAAE
jgi:hypothetical protein